MMTPPNQPIAVMEYQTLRLLIGGIALLFPPVLYIGQAWHGHPDSYPSLSEYYCGVMRNPFVGGMTAIGVFLCSYRGRDEAWLPRWGWLDRCRSQWWAREGFLSIIAGIAAIGVAMLPAIYETTQWAHYICAAILFLALARFAVLFSEETDQIWLKCFFWSCAGIIVLMMLLIVGEYLYWKGPILAWEWIAVWAFAVAWIAVSRRVEIESVARRLGAAGKNPANGSD